MSNIKSILADHQSCDNLCDINCHRLLTRLLREDFLKKSDSSEFGEKIRKEFSHLIYREKHREKILHIRNSVGLVKDV